MRKLFPVLACAFCLCFVAVPAVRAQDDFTVAKITRTLERIEKRIDALEESQAELRSQVNSLRASSLSVTTPVQSSSQVSTFSSSAFSAYGVGAGGGCSTGSCGTGGGMMRGRRGR